MYPWSGKHLLAIAQNAEAIRLKDLHIWQPNKKRNGNNLDGEQNKAKANKQKRKKLPWGKSEDKRYGKTFL